MELENKTLLVTGGANGIGRTLVEVLLERNATVGVFDIDEDSVESLKKKHKAVYPIICDLTDISQVETAVEQFYQKVGKVDVLVNNAGMIFSAPLVSIGPDGIKKHNVDMWHKVISVNLSSVFYVTSNVVEKMMKRRTRGVIVNVSSISAGGNAGQSAYSAAKAGVNALTATWAKELSPLGIRVVGVAPGFTDTNSTRHALRESVLEDIRQHTPLRRLGKAPEIVAGIISVIENDFFNGKTFELDGGLII